MKTGESKVHDGNVEMFAPPLQHHIVWLEVAMDDARGMQSGYTGKQLAANLYRLADVGLGCCFEAAFESFGP
jgi:hypothetical protein